MLIGYARVSTLDQNPALQLDALHTTGCERIFIEKANPAFCERHVGSSQPGELLSQDTFYVGKLKGIGKLKLLTPSVSQRG